MPVDILKERFWMGQWPPMATSKVAMGTKASLYENHANAMMFQMKTQAQLAGILTNKMVRYLPDGAIIIAKTNHGQDTIEIYKPEVSGKLPTLGGKTIRLYLIYRTNDWKLYRIDLISKKSQLIQNPPKFWKDENFYQGPWEADFDGGFGASTAVAQNEFKMGVDPLIIDTATHNTWQGVIDHNFNLSGLNYFPVIVTMNVPGTSPHYGLNASNCFDYPLCFSAIIPPNSCALCFAYWPMWGILPLDGDTLCVMPEVYVPLVRDRGKTGEDGVNLSYFEWTKKSLVWSRGAVTGSPQVDITGKNNYTLNTQEEADALGEQRSATSFRESIYFDSSRGNNSESGNWWNTWNESLHIYQPCWVDIARGFGGDEVGFYPFWNWLHETPTTGIAAYPAYANLIWGGNTRSAGGWRFHFKNYNPVTNEEETWDYAIKDMDESLSLDVGPCDYSGDNHTVYNPNCSLMYGATDTANATGSMSGKYFFPIATLGNKRILFTRNEFSGSVLQNAGRHSGGYNLSNYPAPWCDTMLSCCDSVGWYCFGLCPGCESAVPFIREGGTDLSMYGTQSHSFVVLQELQIAKVNLNDGSLDDIITIDTGIHSYYHEFSGSSYYRTNRNGTIAWPYSNCDAPIAYCGCNQAPFNSPPSFSASDTEEYSRNVTSFEVVDYASDPYNDNVAVLYKKYVIVHSCQTSGITQTNWVHSGTRTVTWHLYVRVGESSETYDLNPTVTITRSPSQVGTQTATGSRLWGGSLQINKNYLAFSYVKEDFKNLGENFGNIIGQTIYPGPMNLEDRNIEPFYGGGGGEIIFPNVGCVWEQKEVHYGIINLQSTAGKFVKTEWKFNIENSSTDSLKKVYTVGLLPDNKGHHEHPFPEGNCPICNIG
jgi:hypothetical protein